MLNKHKVARFLLLSILASLIPTGAFGITLSSGQSLDFSFDHLAPADQPIGFDLDISVYWWPPIRFSGLLTIDFYEDPLDDEPFYSSTATTSDLFGITADFDQWNDLDGRIVMILVGGTHQFDSLTFGAIVDGQYFARTYDLTAVPLPPALILFASSLFVVGRGGYRNYRSGDH